MKKAIDHDLLKTIKKTSLFFVLTSLFIAFFVPLLFYFSIIKTDKNNMKQQIHDIESRLDYKKNILLEDANNPVIMAYLKGEDENIWEVNRMLYGQKHQSSTQHQFFILSESGEVLISSDSVIQEAYSTRYFRMMTDFNNQAVDEVIIKKVTSTIPKEEDFLMMYKAIHEEDNVLGYLVFLLDNSSFPFLKSKDSRYIFSDSFDNVIFADVPELSRPSGTYRHVLSENERKMLNVYHHVESDFNTYPYKLHRYYAIQDTLRFIYMAIMLVAVFSILIIVMHRIYYNQLIRDNLRFSFLIREAILAFSKGDLSYRIPHENEVETQTDYFVDKYNEVLNLVEETIHSNNMMKELASDAERRLLHSQFNPHFIFNVLETIRYSLPDDAVESEEMIESLSKIMRYSVYVTEDVVSLEQDIQYIQEYLKLQKLRYEDRLNFVINIDENAYSKQVPKLVIQPLVENAIKHGFKDDEPLNITIDISMNKNNIIISIQDDGIGIDPGNLEHLQYRIDRIKRGFEVDATKNIGVLNTVKRLSHFFKDEYVFMIESAEKQGTDIMIMIKGADND